MARISSFEQLPQDIFSNIMYRVSYEDFFNMQLSSEAVADACDAHLKEDGLHQMDPNPWRYDEARYFRLCLNNGNPEATYRETIYLFFLSFFGFKKDWAMGRLERLKTLGHFDSCYAIGMIHILTGQKKMGIQCIGEIEEGNIMTRGIEMSRKSFLGNHSGVGEIDGNRFVRENPKCCTRKKHMHMTGKCVECRCDNEIDHVWFTICGRFTR